MLLFQKQLCPLLKQLLSLSFKLKSSPCQFLPYRLRKVDMELIAIVISVIGSVVIVHPVCFYCEDSRDQSLVQCGSSGLCHMTSAECDARLAQLANITFFSPHAKKVTIDCNIVMSLWMCPAMLASLLLLGPTQVITCGDQRLCQQRTWAHNLSDYKSRLVMVE